MEFAAQLNKWGTLTDEEFKSFKASNGYINNLKKRKGVKLIKLFGELSILSEQAYESVMHEFKVELETLIDKHDVKQEHIYNADQTGNYFKRIPCTTICSNSRSAYIKGTKVMKDKAKGAKCPLTYVGK